MNFNKVSIVLISKKLIKSFFCVGLFFTTLFCSAQTLSSDVKNTEEQIVLPDDILATLRQGHPRLLVRSLQDFEVIRNKIPEDAFLKKVSKKIVAEADDLMNKPAVTYDLNPQLGGQLLEVSRMVYRRIYILAMSYRLTHDRKYADRAWQELFAASQFPDWNPYDFLDVSEMVHGFAIGYDWLYDVWTPAQRKIIKQAMMDKGLLRGYLAYNGLENQHLVDWPKSVSNWNQVCSAGMTMGALAIADEEPLLCSFILKNAIKRVPNTMNMLEPDGASEEGPGYWKFGTQYNVAMIASLETALGTDFGLSKLNGFSKTGEYFLAMAGSGGHSFNYADCWTDLISSPELFWFATRYNQPLLAAYQTAHPDYVPVELLWYQQQQSAAEDLPLDNYFRFCEVATMRTSWKDPDAWFVGFKAGRNAANHSHLDIGSFVLDKGGKRWAVDLGHDSYALPGYFNIAGPRWSYYRMKAEGHNTLVIDPDSNPDQNTKAVSKITKFVSSPSASFGIMDLTDAYAGKVKAARRGVLLQDKKRVIIQDEVTATKPIADLYWFMQTPAAITISKNKRLAVLTIDDKQLAVEVYSPASAYFEVLEAKPLPASAQPASEDSNVNIKRLTIHLKNVVGTTIAVVFKEMNDKATIKLKPLAQW